MRIRSIRPEFWTSEDIAALDWDTRLIFIGLWSYVDDNGVGRDVDKLIVADLFPLEDDPRDTLATVHRALATLSDRFLITRYMADGKPYLHITTWEKHQKIDRPGKSRYPLPTSTDTCPREILATPSREARETPSTGEGEKGRRGEGEKSAATGRGTRLPAGWAPSPEDLAVAAEYGVTGALLAREIDTFRDHWAAQPGQKGVKLDWPATWRNWVRRNRTKVDGNANGYVQPSKRLPAAWTS